MTDLSGPNGDMPDEPRPLSSRRMLGQLGVFLGGFLLLLALHGVFTYLVEELARQTENERARLFVGEQIVTDIRLVESDVYRMATTLGVLGQQRIGERIGERIGGIRHNLDVLKVGGVAREVLHLNLEDQDRMIQEVHYDPGPRDERGYILEVIDLTPKLAEIEDKVTELLYLLARREQHRDAAEHQGLLDLERRIKVFLKKLPPLFTRLTENANRMFFESHQRLAQIEVRIDERTRNYRVAELLLVITIIVSVMLLGLRFARSIERSNQHLAEARDRMRTAKEEAERANRAKSEFLSRMSHELRTPLNAVLGFSQLLAIDPDLNEEQKDGVREIDKAGRHLLELINEILDLSRIEAGRLELECIEYSVSEVAEEILGIMAGRARDRGLALLAYVSPRLPPVVTGDPTRLKQVLLNLLGNAVKFTEAGEVELRIEADRQSGMLHCEIRDTGIGFDEQTRARLFQPFTQADESTTRRFGGSGLGLVICKELVQAMGGRIDAASEPGRGARFWFELPLEGDWDAESDPANDLAGMPVLLLIHNPSLRRNLIDYLTELGAQAGVAERRQDLVPLLREGQVAGRPWRLLLVEVDPASDDARLLPAEMAAETGLQRPLLGLIGGAGADLPRGDYDLALPQYLTPGRLLEDLPRDWVAPPAAPAPSEAPAFVPGAGTEVTVLLVEDQPPNQLVAGNMLKRLGVAARCVDNGQAALEALRDGGYDLVFMDMQMPVMDGLEATRRLRSREAELGLPPTPVVAMTANAMENDRDACLAAGMDDHLPKPISLQALDSALARWVPGYRRD